MATRSDEFNIRRCGGDIRSRFHLISAVAAEVPRSNISKLRSMSGVEYVELDARVFALEQTVPWGIAAIQACPDPSLQSGDRS